MAADVDVKTLVSRPMALGSEMPFAGEKCLVTVALERFGERHFLVREVVAVGGSDERIAGGLAGLPGNPIGDVHPHRMAAGQNTRARGAANRARGVTLGEPHAAGSKPIDVGCLMKFATVCTNIRPTHIINQEKQEIGLLGSVRVKETTKGTKKNKDAKQGAHAHEDTLRGRRWQWRVN